MENTPDKKGSPIEDEEDALVRRDGFAGPEGQVETDNPIETDGAEVTGITHGDVPGRKPVGGAS